MYQYQAKLQIARCRHNARSYLACTLHAWLRKEGFDTHTEHMPAALTIQRTDSASVLAIRQGDMNVSSQAPRAATSTTLGPRQACDTASDDCFRLSGTLACIFQATLPGLMSLVS